MCTVLNLTVFFPVLCCSWANKLDVLTRASTSDPEVYLAHPVNAYKLMKRLNTEWSELESLVLQDPSDGKIRSEGGRGYSFYRAPLCVGVRRLVEKKV